jgi:hypothetical protein
MREYWNSRPVCPIKAPSKDNEYSKFIQVKIRDYPLDIAPQHFRSSVARQDETVFATSQRFARAHRSRLIGATRASRFHED